MSPFIWLVASILLLAGAGFFSGCEMGLYALNRVRLRLRAEQNQAGSAATLLELTRRRDEAVMAILLLQNIAGYFLTVTTAKLLVEAWSMDASRVEFYSALILSPLIFVVGDVVPKNWFRQDADRLMYGAARLLRWNLLLLRATGIPWVMSLASREIARRMGQDEREEWLGGRGEVLGLLREGAEGVLNEEQTQIVERVMEFSRIQARTIMIPRRRVVAVPIDIDRRSFEHIVRLHAYSRLPVIARDGRSVAGIVSVPAVLAEEDFDLAAKLQTPLLMRGNESAAHALIRLQQSGANMAIVTEPRQPFVGIVTLKDVVEEIFGELPAW